MSLLFKDKPFKEDRREQNLTDIGFKLISSIPNPFKETSELYFFIPGSEDIKISVRKIFGQEIMQMKRYYQDKGEYHLTLDLKGRPDGIYFIILFADQKEVDKIKIIKTK